MKIEAGWKLCQRNPSAAPAVSAASTPAASRSSESAMIANVAAAIVQTPAASPSTPSVKFTTFITATIPISVSGLPQSPRSSGLTNGSVTFSTQTPGGDRDRARPRTGRASFSHGGRPPSRASSIAPTSVIAIAPSTMPRVSVSAKPPITTSRRRVVRQEDQRRDDRRDQDREPAEARHGLVVQVPLARLVDHSEPPRQPRHRRRDRERDRPRQQERPEGVERVHPGSA